MSVSPRMNRDGASTRGGELRGKEKMSGEREREGTGGRELFTDPEIYRENTVA